jgi:hypothetical protein
MRCLIAVTASVAMLVAQVPLVPAFGQSAPPAPQAATQNPVIEATFKAFPNGGEPLSMRIADLLVANPKLATELLIYMRNAQGLSRAQKVAAEHGLAAAADRLGIQARQVCPPRAPAGACCPDGTLRDAQWGCGDDLWFVALAFLGFAAQVGLAAGFSHQNAQVIPTPVPSATPH